MLKRGETLVAVVGEGGDHRHYIIEEGENTGRGDWDFSLVWSECVITK
jgi:hypothetical protein